MLFSGMTCAGWFDGALRRFRGVWLAFGLAVMAAQAQPNALLDQWIAAQTHLQTWSADAIQTRSFQTLSQPLVSTGKVWVALPDRFRWELGQPPRTIAIRQPKTLFLVYPRLKQAEKYSLASDQPGPWRDALALLEASFPRDRAELEAQFRVVSVTQSNSIARIDLQPKSGFARKFVSAVQVSFDTRQYLPVSTELKFSDGSFMRNDFANGVTNAPLTEALFEPRIGPDFKLVEPLQGK